MTKRPLDLAIFSILGLVTCIPRFAAAQTEKTNSADTVFGISLGYSTIDDIKKLPITKQEGGTESSAEHNGKTAWAYPTQLPSLSFSIEGQRFKATFFEDKVFQLRLLKSEWSDDLDDAQFLAELKNSFNKKYKKGQTYSRQEKGSGTEGSYTYETWRVSPELIVEIRNHKYKVLSYATCMQYSSVLSGPRLVSMQIYCNGMPSGSVKYSVTYKHIDLNEKAFKFFLEEENRNKLKDMNERKEKLGKF